MWGSVSGLRGGADVGVASTLIDHREQRWITRATYRADADGCLDLASAAPIEADWHGSDAYGLYWSMRRETGVGRSDAGASSVDVVTSALTPLRVVVAIESGSQHLEAMIERQIVSRSTVVEWRDTTVANLFLPHRTRAPGAVIVLGGSAGGFAWSNQVAAMIAASGRAAVAVAYFDWDGAYGLPTSITEVPLERFGDVLDRLAHDSPVGSGPVDVVGFSKGAEAALALASRRDDIANVAAVSPSAYVWESARTDPREPPRSSWTWRGEPLPFLRIDADDDFYENFDKTQLRRFHELALEKQHREPARIQVEAVAGDTLLVSGGADSTWPAAAMADQIVAACGRSDRRHVRHLSFEDAGHLLLPPGLPAYRWDGDPKANAKADRAAWSAIRKLLRLT